MPEWLQASVLSVVVGLQAWILVEIVGLKVKQAKADEKFDGFKDQLGRIVSDIESEKDTRARLHTDFETRLRTLEHKRTR